MVNDWFERSVREKTSRTMEENTKRKKKERRTRTIVASSSTPVRGRVRSFGESDNEIEGGVCTALISRLLYVQIRLIIVTKNEIKYEISII